MGTTGEWRGSTRFEQYSIATDWTGLDRLDVQPDDALLICLVWDSALVRFSVAGLHSLASAYRPVSRSALHVHLGVSAGAPLSM